MHGADRPDRAITGVNTLTVTMDVAVEGMTQATFVSKWNSLAVASALFTGP